MSWKDGSLAGSSLGFPASGQTWPSLTGLYLNASSVATPKNITGTVDANGKVDLTMDYDSIAKEGGSMLGSGAVIVMDDTRCMVKSLQRLSYFYAHESCGQCTPCREGTGWLSRVVDRIENGQGRASDMDLLDSVAGNIMGRTICALGDAAAMPVRGMLKHYRHEFEHHIEHKTCVVGAYA